MCEMINKCDNFSVAQQNQQTRLNIIRFPECRLLKLYSALAIPIPDAVTHSGWRDRSEDEAIFGNKI